jgi:hypothetical protein
LIEKTNRSSSLDFNKNFNYACLLDQPTPNKNVRSTNSNDFWETNFFSNIFFNIAMQYAEKKKENYTLDMKPCMLFMQHSIILLDFITEYLVSFIFQFFDGCLCAFGLFCLFNYDFVCLLFLVGLFECLKKFSNKTYNIYCSSKA